MSLGGILGKNLIAILGMLATLATGYFAGLTRAANVEMATADQGVRIAALELNQKTERTFHECVRLSIILKGIDPKTPLPCNLEVPG